MSKSTSTASKSTRFAESGDYSGAAVLRQLADQDAPTTTRKRKPFAVGARVFRQVDGERGVVESVETYEVDGQPCWAVGVRMDSDNEVWSGTQSTPTRGAWKKLTEEQIHELDVHYELVAAFAADAAANERADAALAELDAADRKRDARKLGRTRKNGVGKTLAQKLGTDAKSAQLADASAHACSNAECTNNAVGFFDVHSIPANETVRNIAFCTDCMIDAGHAGEFVLSVSDAAERESVAELLSAAEDELDARAHARTEKRSQKRAQTASCDWFGCESSASTTRELAGRTWSVCKEHSA